MSTTTERPPRDESAGFPLTFVTRDGDNTSFWSPNRGGDYEACNARGRGYAEEALSYMRGAGNPVLLGSIVRAITSSGIYGGVEVGFCHRLAVELLR